MSVPFVVGLSYRGSVTDLPDYVGLWRYDGAGGWTQTHQAINTAEEKETQVLHTYRTPDGVITATVRVIRPSGLLTTPGIRFYRSYDSGRTWTTGLPGWVSDDHTVDDGGFNGAWVSGINEDDGSITILDKEPDNRSIYVTHDLGTTWEVLVSDALIYDGTTDFQFGQWYSRGRLVWTDFNSAIPFDEPPQLVVNGSRYEIPGDHAFGHQFIGGAQWCPRGIYTDDTLWVFTVDTARDMSELFRFDQGTASFTSIPLPVLGDAHNPGGGGNHIEYLHSFLPRDLNHFFIQSGCVGPDVAFPFPRVWRTDDGGDTWVLLRDGSVDVPSYLPEGPGQLFLDWDETNPDELIMLGTSNMWSSADSGTTWTEIAPPAVGIDFENYAFSTVVCRGRVGRGYPGLALLKADATQRWFRPEDHGDNF